MFKIVNKIYHVLSFTIDNFRHVVSYPINKKTHVLSIANFILNK